MLLPCKLYILSNNLIQFSSWVLLICSSYSQNSTLNLVCFLQIILCIFFFHYRCLRMVHNSWNVFATFSMDWKVVNQSCCKKRRLLLDVSDFQGELSSIPEQCISQSLEEEDEKEFEYTCENHQNKRQPFKEAKDCLISLKASVESLHRKNLFPYNPLVLLKRCVFSLTVICYIIYIFITAGLTLT